MRKPVQDLVKFLTTVNLGKKALYMTYFDEADQLGLLFWIMLRLLSNQYESTPMWYVFMATKSSVSYFHPAADQCQCSLFSLAQTLDQ
jgi:hypothetical protein